MRGSPRDKEGATEIGKVNAKRHDSRVAGLDCLRMIASLMCAARQRITERVLLLPT
jgi:hypothetical protein